MTTVTLGHSYTATGLSKTWLLDTSVNIQKRRETVQFKSTSSTNNLNLAYVQGTTITSEGNVSVRDRSTALPENKSVSRNSDESLDSVNGFNIETESFLVTDEFAVAAGGQAPLPLFYVHTVNRPLLSGESYSDIQILDSSFRVLSLVEARVDLTTGTVYNNLVNTFDQVSGLSELFYISYLIKDTATNTLTRFMELVSNAPVYSTATFADLDEFGNFLPGVKAYILEEDIGASFNVILPSVTDYSIRRLASQRLEVLDPPPSGADDPWFISVRNSSFISSVDTGGVSNSIYKYRIAEFNAQGFVPFFPYKLTTETSTRVNKRTVKTIQDKVAQSADEGLYLDILVYDSEGTIRFALTSDPTKAGTASPVSGTSYSNALLGASAVAGTELNDSATPVGGSSIDGLYGFIVLPTGYEINETDVISSSYYYEEDKYEFSFINLNPLTNTALVKQRVVIFAKPELLGSTISQTLFYLVVNEDGLVVESNYNIDSVEASLSDGVEVQAAITAETLWYDRDPDTVSWVTASGVDFVQNYTVQGTPNPDAFLILGEVYVRENTQPNSMVINDIRERGGGLIPEEQTALEGVQPESAWNWDVGMWDGYPYPGAAAFFVDVPSIVLEACGGSLNPAAVREIVGRHIGLGIYPVIHKYNNYEPTITGVDITTSGTYIGWTIHPDDAVFDVYTSALEEGPWVLTVTGLEQSSNSNSVTLDIPENLNRFIVVTGRQGVDGPVCISGPLSVEDPGFIPATTISGIA